VSDPPTSTNNEGGSPSLHDKIHAQRLGIE
jgi:hypothetical protein